MNKKEMSILKESMVAISRENRLIYTLLFILGFVSGSMLTAVICIALL